MTMMRRLAPFLLTQRSTRFVNNRALISRQMRFFNTQQLSMTQLVKNFYEKYQESPVNEQEENLNLTQIVKTMDQILKTQVTAAEYQQYNPISDELSHYVVKTLKNQKKSTVAYHQAKTLSEFGLTFDVQDKEYWRIVQQSFENQIDEMTPSEQIQTLSQLRHFGLLTNQIIQKSVDSLSKQVQGLSLQELVIFTMIYTSQDTQNAINRDKNFEEKLDFLLSKHIGSMNSNEFAMICNSIAFDDRKGELAEGSINFITFLTEGINQVQNWLQSSDFSISDLPYIFQAYNIISQNLDQDTRNRLFESFEEAVFENAQHLKVNEATQFVQIMNGFGSKDLLELLDRIIGANIYDVPVQELVPTIRAFAQSPNSRPKIFVVFYGRVKKDLNQFSIRELSELSVIFTELLPEVQEFLDLLEPYIQKKLHSLQELDLSILLKTFQSKKNDKSYEIVQQLESLLINQVDTLEFATVADMLYFYAKNRTGGRIVIESLIRRFETENLDALNITASSLAQAVIALNICGANSTIADKFMGLIEKNLDHFTPEETILVGRILALEQRNEKLDNLKAKVDQRTAKQ